MFFHRTDDQDVSRRGVLNALAAFAYIGAVALFMANLQKNFSGPDDRILAPIGLLSLLVLSATVMGTLIFGAPVMLYIDGKKGEAVKLLAWTIGSFAAITVCIFLVIMFTTIR